MHVFASRGLTNSLLDFVDVPLFASQASDVRCRLLFLVFRIRFRVSRLVFFFWFFVIRLVDRSWRSFPSRGSSSLLSCALRLSLFGWTLHVSAQIVFVCEPRLVV